MKKLLYILCSAILAISSSSATGIAAEQGDIVIIYTNDTHCETDSASNFADISAIEAVEMAKGNEVIIVDAGDAVQGGTIGAISKGAYIIDIMNEVGYDVAALGNHEFDYQVPRLMELSEMADFPYISTNFVWAKDGKRVFEPYYLTSIDGTDIAFVSALTPHTITSTAPEYFKDENGEFLYDFCGDRFFDTIQESVDEATANGADIVIALTHLGTNDSDLPYTSKELISGTSGIDAVIDAHSHTVIESEELENKDGENVILSSTGSNFQNIGIMRISQGDITTELINEEYKKDGIPSDGQTAYEKTSSFIDGIKAKYELELEKNVAVSEANLTIYNPDKYSEETGLYREVRRGETNMGDFCADAYRAVLGSDIAIINGGGVRADIEKGDVSYGDLLNVNPFGNNLCIIEVTGKQIIDALEHGAKSYPDEDGAFLQVSGLSYEIDENIPSSVVLDENGIFVEVSGERRVTNVLINGKEIDETAIYTLGGSNFTLLNSGDGFSMFQGAKLVDDLICTDLDALIKYASEELDGVISQGYANPHGDGRIKIISQAYSFTDIQNHWAKDIIESAVRANLMTGVSETEFAPDLNITRGMFVTILYRLEGEPTSPKLNFQDVSSGEYYSGAIAWAKANEIINGISDTEFAPDSNITREQLAAILHRYAKFKGCDVSVGEDTNILSYDDVFDISEYAIPSMQWTCGAGLMKGKTESTLNPHDNTTRAEAAAILQSFITGNIN